MNLKLQPFNETHIDCVMDWENDPAFRDDKFFAGPYSREDIAALLETLSEQHSTAKRFIVTVDDSPTGICDLCEIDFEEKSAFVTILNAAPELRRKGIALQALLLLEDEAHELGLNLLFAWIENENEPSLKLFQKANYLQSKSSKKLILDGVEYIHVTLMEKWLKKG